MVDMSDFDAAARGPGTKPGGKVDRFLDALDDDRREAAKTALRDTHYSGYTIERVFRKWAQTDPALDPPGHTSVEKWRERVL